MTRRIFLAAAPLASCYAGALAYGITQIKTSSIPVYKLLFLIEGESPVRSQDGSRSIPPVDELIPLTQVLPRSLWLLSPSSSSPTSRPRLASSTNGSARSLVSAQPATAKPVARGVSSGLASWRV